MQSDGLNMNSEIDLHAQMFQSTDQALLDQVCTPPPFAAGPNQVLDLPKTRKKDRSLMSRNLRKQHKSTFNDYVLKTSQLYGLMP